MTRHDKQKIILQERIDKLNYTQHNYLHKLLLAAYNTIINKLK